MLFYIFKKIISIDLVVHEQEVNFLNNKSIYGSSKGNIIGMSLMIPCFFDGIFPDITSLQKKKIADSYTRIFDTQKKLYKQ